MTRRYSGKLPGWWRERDERICAQARDGIHTSMIAEGMGLSEQHTQAILRANGWHYDHSRKEWVRG